MTFLRTTAFLFCLIPILISAQHTFFKGTNHHIETVYTGAHITDSMYYVSTWYKYDDTSHLYTHGYSTFSLNGDSLGFYPDVSNGLKEYHYYSRTVLDTNYRGNLVNGYIEINTDTINGIRGRCVKITEWSPTQGLINKFTIDLRQDGLELNNYTSVIPSRIDSSYYTLVGYKDWNTDNPNNSYFDGKTGTKLINMDESGAINWITTYPVSSTRTITPRSFRRASDSTFLIGINRKDWDMWDEHLSDGMGTFYLVNHNGVYYDGWTFTEPMYLEIGYGATTTPDGGMVSSYLRSTYERPDTFYIDSFVHMASLVKFDLVDGVDWKVDLLPEYHLNEGLWSVPNTLIVDSTQLIGAHFWSDSWYETPGVIQSSEYMSGLNIFNRNLSDGQLKWERKYSLWEVFEGNDPEVDSTVGNGEDYITFEIHKTKDDGYLLVGRAARISDSVVGFLLKTNCYGFLGAPEAGLEYSYGNDLVVNFHNVSTQAGEFEWIFGDETTWTTGEDELEVAHTYPTLATYNGMLIAHGCNGEADTIHFEVDPVKHLDPSAVTEGNGYFSIFPNPVLSGEQVFIYIAALEENTELVIRDNSGKLVERIQIDASESAYQQLPRLASGEYYLSLFVNGEKKKTQKLVVAI